MLRISTLKSASGYYTKSLTKGDYYSEQAEISGEWQGLGAKKLGVFGEIKKEQFDLLCAGHHPLTGDQLSSRIVSNRREAYDFTFSVPKSVSVLSAVSSPEVASLIQEQIKESMKFTMTEVEKNIQTRIRESGKNDNRVTGNIVYGYFLHKNARPIDGYSDPHLHVHAVVMNLTFDGVDKKWKAIQMRDKKENASYYQSIFNSTLANRLQNIGLGITKTNINFEIAKITDQTIKTFSRRTDEIEKEAIAQNIQSVDAKGKLGARTRQSKSDNHSQSELQGIYKGLINPEQGNILKGLNQKLQQEIEIRKDFKPVNLALNDNPDPATNDTIKLISYPKNSKIVIVDADEFKKHFNDFAQANHHIYGKMARDLYNSSLQDPKIQNVIFTSGGSGSGKSEILLNTIVQSKFEGMVVDGTLADFDPAVSSIDKALASGKKIQIQGIVSDIKVSYTHVKERELKTGRGVVLPVFLDKHIGFVDTFPKLIERYNDNPNVQFSIVDARALNKNITKDKATILDLFKGISYNRDNLQTELSNYEQQFNLTHHLQQPTTSLQLTTDDPSQTNQNPSLVAAQFGGNYGLSEPQTQWNNLRFGVPQVPSRQDSRGVDGGNNSNSHNRSRQLPNLETKPWESTPKVNETQKWLDYTLENHFERHSTSSEQRLIGEVIKNGIGQTNLELVTKAIERYKKDGILIDELTNDKVNLESIKARNNLSPAITTQVALSEEQNIIKIVDVNIRLHSPISVRYSNEIFSDQFLNPNQKEVVSKIFTNSDGITLIEGKAGTGKTTTLKSIETGLNQSGYNITILAPTNKAVEVLQMEGFENAMTVSKFLAEENKVKNELANPNQSQKQKDTLQKINSEGQNSQTNKLTQYLIVDEASLVSVRQLNQLLNITNQNSQRLLLVGDTKQHKSVERGNILKTIQDYSEIRTYSLNKIQRQTKSESKSAVEDLSKGKVEEGIQKFQKLGFVKEIEDDKTRLQTVANLYLKNLPQVYTSKIQNEEVQVEVQNPNQEKKNLFDRIKTGDIFNNQKHQPQYETQTKLTSEKIEYQKLTSQSPTLVITPTHKDGQDIHNAIRQELKSNNLIGTEDHSISTIRSLTWTSAQKSEPSNYQPGQILQFSRNIKDFKIGDRFVVVSSNQEQKNESKQNSIKDLNPNQIINQNTLIQNTKTGETKDIPTTLASYFDVFLKESLKISKNDLIQIQSRSEIKDLDGKIHKTNNGSTYQIKSISPKTGDLTLSNNWIIPKDFGNLKSAYYSTSQSSQGQTVQHSIFYTSNQSLSLLNQEMVYVANSRFKESNMILTPNLEQFIEYAQKGEMKSVAISVVENSVLKAINMPNLESQPTISNVKEVKEKHKLIKSKGVSMGR
jgi:conjugative relaxase-like TrwC/TraI family protein